MAAMDQATADAIKNARPDQIFVIVSPDDAFSHASWLRAILGEKGNTAFQMKPISDDTAELKIINKGGIA